MDSTPDAMQTVWAQYDAKLDEALRLNRRAFTESMLGRTRSSLHRLLWSVSVEAALDLILLVKLGSMLYAAFGMVRFFVPTLLLDAGAIAAFAALVAQIALASGIDYSKPVASIQRDLERLRVLRLRTFRWTLLLAPLAWVPLLIVALWMFFGIDAYRTLGTAYLGANAAFGIAVFLGGYWLLKRMGPRLATNRFAAAFVRTIEGSEVRDSLQMIAELRRFDSSAEA